MNIHSYDPHELPPRSDRKRAGNTATTDSRSQSIRADRRGGQITARALTPLSYVGLTELTYFQRPKNQMASQSPRSAEQPHPKATPPSCRRTVGSTGGNE